MKSVVLMVFTIFVGQSGIAGEVLTLQLVLELAYQSNPEIAAYRHRANAEEFLITSQATPDDPMIGVSTIDRNVKTEYATITQKVRFPTKYALQAKAQGRVADSFKAKFDMKKLQVREQVVSLYYAIYSIQKIIQLTEANMEAVREFARAAEKKYAAGRSPQGDSMKAHFELTQLELDLIRLRQEEQALQDSLKAVVADQTLAPLELGNRKIPTPKVNFSQMSGSSEKLTALLNQSSPQIKVESQLLKAAEHKKRLAGWEYAPDFQFQYQQRISGLPEDSKIYSVALTVPLWFWKKSSEASAASAKKMAQEFHLTDTIQKTIAKVKDLKGKVETGGKTLSIYETSLIPQALGAYNSSRAAYRANKTSFLDLLDSERSLYRVKTGFFQALKQYVNHIGQLETQLGRTVSDLDMKSGVNP